MSNADPVCSSCGKPPKVPITCEKCCGTYCTACSDGLTASVGTVSSAVGACGKCTTEKKDIKMELTATQRRSNQDPNLCELHRKLCKIFCLNCSVAICGDCMTDGEQHDQHQITNLAIVYQEKVSDVETKLDRAKKHNDELRRIQTPVYQRNLDLLEKEEAIVRKEIETIAAVSKLEVSSVTSVRKKTLQEKLERTATSATALMELQSMVERLSANEFVRQFSEIDKNCDELTGEPEDVTLLSVDDIKCDLIPRYQFQTVVFIKFLNAKIGDSQVFVLKSAHDVEWKLTVQKSATLLIKLNPSDPHLATFRHVLNVIIPHTDYTKEVHQTLELAGGGDGDNMFDVEQTIYITDQEFCNNERGDLVMKIGIRPLNVVVEKQLVVYQYEQHKDANEKLSRSMQSITDGNEKFKMIATRDSHPRIYRGFRLPGVDFTFIPKPTNDTDTVSPVDLIAPTLKQCRKLTNATKDEYIKLRNSGADGLPYSAKLRCGDTYWKLHGDGGLVTIGTNYIAQVSIGSVPELDEASDFGTSKELLLAHLKFDHVLLDKLTKETSDVVGLIQSLLHDLVVDCATSMDSARCLMELWRIAKMFSYKFTVEFCEEISSNEFIQCNQLKSAIKEYVKKNHKLEERSIFQRSKDWIQGLMKKNYMLEQAFKTLIGNHKISILEECSSRLKQQIGRFEPNRALLLRRDDVKLFSDVECALNEDVFRAALPKVETNFIKRVTAIKPHEFCQSMPLTNGVYFHVCKSMLEMANRVEKELKLQNILEYGNEWKATRMDSAQVTSKLTKCFVQQLRTLVTYANLLEPGKPTARHSLSHEFHIEVFKRSSQPVQDDLRIWLILVDKTMKTMFQETPDRIDAYSAVLQKFHQCAQPNDTREESQESVRTIAHNVLEFVAQVEQSTSGQNEMDLEILQKQIATLGTEFLSGERAAFQQYRDTMDAWKIYWKRFNEVLPKLAEKLEGDHLKAEVRELKNGLASIVSQILDKQAESEDVIKFFRAYNDLFSDVEDMPFEWYVQIGLDETRKNTMARDGIVKKVLNRLSDTDSECYQVQKGKYDEFAKAYAVEGVPKHYQIEVVKTLLNDILKVVQKQEWSNAKALSTKDQLSATVLLINSVRSSLLYLKEQPDYVDFEAYYEETVKPFSSVIDESVSLEDFKKRVELIEVSFWYIRNHSAIGIDKALELFAPDNSNFNESLLKSCFQRYDEQFLKYMVDYSDLGEAEKIQKIVQDVRSKVKPMSSSKWTAELKQTLVPEILAALAAVWSIQISKDVAKTGKCLKPHAMQILSILRLLGVDESATGVEKHLAQILTGQGKSVVLALTAAVLALFGQTVVIVCYSSYLVDRDSEDFQKLFQAFSVQFLVTYKIFDTMAFSEIQHLVSETRKYMTKCIGIANNTQSYERTSSNLGNAVLLIDEVDVFFMEKFYGACYNPVFMPVLPGLGRIQRQIWELVQNNCCNVRSEIDTHISYSTDPKIVKFRSLLERPRRYKLISIDSAVSEIEYTNLTLLSTHLDRMIAAARDIHFRPEDDEWIRTFKINPQGIITHKDDHGVFRSTQLAGYHNAFAYFKLQKHSFVQTVNGVDNFGYINLRIASFSYAKIPEKYSLILGVTGTLNELSAYEKNAIKNHYQIRRSSIMPSFFGSSNLKFNPRTDFKCHPNPIEWTKAIFARINAIITAHRSVIVFFTTDTEIDRFRREFQSQLDRLNEITANTEATTRERFIAEAGLTRTVTLASREMGRGVDYKSSLSVEKNGGVHVIQTFFSLDDKEETQIKGRTARKDNHGSYELIVCQPHLVALNLVTSSARADSITYAYLVDTRKQLTDMQSDSKAKQLERANERHYKSISFCENI